MCEYLYYIIYKTINKVNNKYYIGQHRTNNIDDGYLGSGIELTVDIKKYGKSNFIREILYLVDNSTQLDDMEDWIVNGFIIRDPNSYNRGPGGKFGWNKDHPNYITICNKMKIVNKGQIPWNKGKKFKPEENPLYGKIGKNNPTSKSYKIYKQNGTVEIIKGLNHWCVTYGYRIASLHSMLRGRINTYKDIIKVERLSN